MSMLTPSVPGAANAAYRTIRSAAAPNVQQGVSRVRIVYGNDQHEKIQSMPRKVTAYDYFSRQGETQGRDVLRLDGGDNNIGVEANEWSLNVMLMNMIRYHAVAKGNHELDVGTRTFANGLGLANFPIVVSNLEVHPQSGIAQKIKEGKIHDGPLVIHGAQGSYGIVGVTTPQLHSVLSPKVDLEGCEVEDFEDTVEIVREQVEELEERGIHNIILLSHMDVEHDIELATKRVSGIDVIGSAHDHREFEGIVPGKNLFKSPRGEPVFLMEAGKNNSYVNVADLVFANGQVIPESNRLHDLTGFAPNPTAEALKTAVLGKPVTQAQILTPYSSANNAFSSDPVAMFTADTMRFLSGSDIALVRSPEIRANIAPGPLTDQMIRELMPFTDPVVRVKVSGRDIWNSLRQSAECVRKNETHPGMLHPSGLFVQMNRQTGNVDFVYYLDRQSNQWKPLPQDGTPFTVAIGEFTVLNDKEFKHLAKPDRIDWRSTVPVRGFFEMGLRLSGAPNRPIAFQDDGRLKIV